MDTLHVWPDNVRAWQFFASIGTRWSYGPSGRPVGFRWESLYPLLDRAAPDPDDWAELRLHLEIMEAAALAAYTEFFPPPKR
ncbi:hypothetical protein GmRootA79_16120 [Acidovorax sp. A79]|uniref:DUF1799 domain-containing protein n=1 Tax=Acidovorax sp. A79 TaxID=3056107 RepID=UPI0034E8E1D2